MTRKVGRLLVMMRVTAYLICVVALLCTVLAWPNQSYANGCEVIEPAKKKAQCAVQKKAQGEALNQINNQIKLEEPQKFRQAKAQAVDIDFGQLIHVRSIAFLGASAWIWFLLKHRLKQRKLRRHSRC